MGWLGTIWRLITSTVGVVLGILLVGLGGIHLVVRDPAWLAVFTAITLVGIGLLFFSGRYAWHTVSHRV